MALSREVVAALDDAVKRRGLNKRQLVEIALRRELDLPAYPDLPDNQGGLKLPA